MGARSGEEIATALGEISVGIICLTSENLKDPRIMFEAGALSKSVKTARVCPLLFGIGKSEIEGPLLVFQAAKFDKDEMKRVVNMINDELQEKVAPHVIDTTFGVMWPRLEAAVSEALARTEAPPVSERTEREILEEILERSRVAGRLEREFKGRLLSSLGYVIGEMSWQPSGTIDRDRLFEAVRHCQQGYDYLKEVGGAAEFLGLNNLVYYSALLNDASKRDLLLNQSRRLRDVAQERKATNLTLTACGAILRLSSDEEEKRDARRRITDLLQETISERDRKEAKQYLEQFPEGT